MEGLAHQSQLVPGSKKQTNKKTHIYQIQVQLNK